MNEHIENIRAGLMDLAETMDQQKRTLHAAYYNKQPGRPGCEQAIIAATMGRLQIARAEIDHALESLAHYLTEIEGWSEKP